MKRNEFDEEDIGISIILRKKLNPFKNRKIKKIQTKIDEKFAEHFMEAIRDYSICAEE
jgi:hypothetical protein